MRRREVDPVDVLAVDSNPGHDTPRKLDRDRTVILRAPILDGIRRVAELAGLRPPEGAAQSGAGEPAGDIDGARVGSPANVQRLGEDVVVAAPGQELELAGHATARSSEMNRVDQNEPEEDGSGERGREAQQTSEPRAVSGACLHVCPLPVPSYPAPPPA